MIDLDEFVERLCRVGNDRGPRGFPKKQRDREILMKSIRMGLDSARVYREPEINEALQRWNQTIAPAVAVDHVTVRRWLVDYGYLERTPDGSAYRVGFPSRMIAFDLDVEDLDLAATTAAYRDQQARRPRPPGR